MEQNKIKVIIHVEDGMVNDVYSDQNIDLEIIDMDCDDWNIKGDNKQRLAEIRSQIAAGKLFRF